MLVTLTDVLTHAETHHCAIGSFNTPNLTTLQAVIGAAEDLNQPVIIMHAQVHEEMGLCRMSEMAPIMRLFAERARVPVCMHLDHGTDLDYVFQGLSMGFTSVMYDGSTLPTEENVENTKRAVSAAKAVGASVEAEIGSMGAREGGGGNDTSIYTDPQAAKMFVEATGIDALACAFGTAHGFYKDAPKLDFDRLSAIRQQVALPIVMHGGSGVNEADYREVIRRGVRKVNYYTYMAKAGGEAVSQKVYTQFHDVLRDAQQAMRENVKQAIRVFQGQ